MVKSRIQLKKIDSIAAGSTAIISLPIGPRYHSVTLVLGNSGSGVTAAPTVAAILNEIRVRFNNAVQRRVNATRLDSINTDMGSQFASQAYAGAAVGGGRRHLTIYFSEPWRKRLNDQDALAWQTRQLGGNGVFEIELDIVGAITPVISAFALVDDFSTGKDQVIMKWVSIDTGISGTPIELQFQRRPFEALSQVTIFDPAGATIDRARLVIEGREFHDLTKDEANSFNKNVADMNPTSGRYHIVLDHDDRLDDLLAMNYADAQLTLTPSVAVSTTLPMVIQSLGLPNAA